MRYSLIVPHYSDESRLNRFLKTVPIMRDDVEVIVVDDCSPDQSLLKVLQRSWPQVQWLSTQDNAGAGVARNIGLNAAQGRWLVFADSDDEFIEGAFEAFDNVLRDDDELVYFLAEAVQEVDGNPSVRSERFNEVVSGYIQRPNDGTLRCLQLEHVVPWAKVYSRSYIESRKVKFDAVRRSNDVAFNVLAAIQASNVRAEAVAVYRVYRRSESLTADKSSNAFLERFMVTVRLADRLKRLGVTKAVPATGRMLLSVKYGPKVMLKVWFVALCSSMYIEWSRVFDVKRWKLFLYRRAVVKKENIP